MKKYIALFGIMTLFFAGMQLARAQERSQTQIKTQREDVAKQREMGKAKAPLNAQELAKQQTQELTALVKLDKQQAAEVHALFLNIEEKRSRLATVTDDKKRMSELQIVETVKEEKLKNLLTREQFSRYLKTVQNEKQ